MLKIQLMCFQNPQSPIDARRRMKDFVTVQFIKSKIILYPKDRTTLEQSMWYYDFRQPAGMSFTSPVP